MILLFNKRDETRRALSVLMALVACTLSGCTRYYYNGEEFLTKGAALEAQRTQHRAALEKTRPLGEPIADAVRIGIPLRSVICERATSGYDFGYVRSYVTEILDNEHVNTVEVIKRRNLFRNTVKQRTRGEHLTPRPGEAVLYLYMPSSSTAGWYFESTATPRTPIFFEHGQPNLPDRVNFFRASIERLIQSERSRSPAARTAHGGVEPPRTPSTDTAHLQTQSAICARQD